MRTTSPGSEAHPAHSYDPLAVERLLFHIDNLFHARAHALLVAEALLFAGVCARWDVWGIALGTAVFAIGLTAVVAIANVNLANKLRWTMEAWREGEPSGLAHDYAQQRVRLGATQLPRSFDLYARWIPALLLVGWLVVAFAAIA